MKHAYSGRWRHGAILVVALVALLVVGLSGGALLKSIVQSHRHARRHAGELQALWLAESGLDRAVARLRADGEYAGEEWRPVVAGGGRVEIAVAKDESQPSRRSIRVTANFPDDPVYRAQHAAETTITLATRGDSP
jgi:Tfp pilus assembly protein PilX